jgi:3-hydroxybutyryl-CoA dehydrogenase
VSVSRVGVLGAGTMGSGIAQIAALGGYETLMYDPDPAALAAGGERAEGGIAKGVERGRWSQAEGDAGLTRLSGTGELTDLTGCELVVEAVPEILELKRELLGSVASVCGPETILATNTSSLRVSEIAAEVPGRERVVGMHFFNPPALMKLVEVVATADSSEAALAATAEVAERMGRTPIRARDTPGFVANRLARPFNLEALRILADGVAEPATIDRVYRLGGGFRMGPFELIDLIGLDVNLAISRSFFAQGGEPERWRPSPIQERMVAEGKLGRKSGQGFYTYGEEPSRSGPPFGPHTPRRRAAIHDQAKGPTLNAETLAGIDPAAEGILLRLFAQIANEAHFALEEGVASREDMNTATRLGLNWPLGSLEIAESIGPARALVTLERLEVERGPAYEPAPLLRTQASGETP